MKRRKLFAAFILTGVWPMGAFAGIPEPDAILYGQVFKDGVAVRADEDVTVIARRGGDDNEIARYVMGQDPDVGDRYVLRIPMESLVADSPPQRTDTLLIGQTVYIRIQEAASSESPAGALTIDERGAVIYLDLLGSRIPCDYNGDGQVSLLDHAGLVECMSAQSAAGGQCMLAFDDDGDGLVTLADFAFFQRLFPGA